MATYTVAVDKCCVLHIGKADKTPAVYLINSVALPAVLSCRDLGIVAKLLGKPDDRVGRGE